MKRQQLFTWGLFRLLVGLIGGCLLGGPGVWAQLPDSLSPPRPVEVDFLFHYYEQDGNHSAVTGGIGTEELSDLGVTTIFLVPLDSQQSMTVSSSINHYTSASTDNIDSYVSSASRKDNHVTLQLGYQKELSDGRRWGLWGGMGLESDYISSSFGGNYGWERADGNRSLDLQVRAFLDTWIVIFPEELRAPGLAVVPTDKRRSYALSATWSQVITPKLQSALTLEVVRQEGLLSTPFHRVYFQDSTLRIERLPFVRWKVPLGLRLNYFATDRWVLRSNSRLYADSFGLLALSLDLESPFKLGPFFSLYPYYRFHTQSAARYFAPYRAHEKTARYYSSDFDLSGFVSHKVGLGFSYAPLYGLTRFRLSPRRMGFFSRLDVRMGRYWRSDGLDSWLFSLNTGFRL